MKKIILMLAAFSAGFLIHAFIFPDFLSTNIDFGLEKDKVLGVTPTGIQNAPQEIKSLTIVTFKDGSFHPSKVWVQKGYYLAIRNADSENQMLLVSPTKEFNTPRGYGLSEEVRNRMDIPGTYQVSEKNSSANLTIVVK